jgi:tryptophan-rich sensory protein
MPQTAERRGSWLWLGLFALAVIAVAISGSLASTSNVDGWYADAAKPPWTPPNWLFGPVWTLLYAGMAISGWLVWRSHAPRRRLGLTLFWVQLALNAAWTPLFFAAYPIWGTPALWVGAAVILALDVVVVACVIVFWRIHLFAGVVMLAYLAWLLYASSLNIGLAVLNG